MEKGNQVVHTKILVHWTLKESENIDKESYINRLSSILKDGLRFGKVDESFNSKNGSIKINTNQDMLCFTETRISKSIFGANKLPFKYGRLGIGLHRKFVIRNGGNPVFYVNPMDSADIINLLDNADFLRCFVKPMNEDKVIEDWDEYDLSHYDDLEWRIIPDRNESLRSKFKTKYDSLGKYSIQKKEDGYYYLSLADAEEYIECIIFPDEKIQNACMDTILSFFKGKRIPIITTWNRLKHL